MTPREKAIELHNKILNVTYDDRDIPGEPTWVSTKCALIAVDEILLIAPMMHMEGFGNLTIREYYKKVKQEIEKL